MENSPPQYLPRSRNQSKPSLPSPPLPLETPADPDSELSQTCPNGLKQSENRFINEPDIQHLSKTLTPKPFRQDTGESVLIQKKKGAGFEGEEEGLDRGKENDGGERENPRLEVLMEEMMRRIRCERRRIRNGSAYVRRRTCIVRLKRNIEILNCNLLSHRGD